MSKSQLHQLLPDMAVFVKVIDTGSFSETARQLGLTPSAISRSVSRLESALGVRLLVRSTRNLRLSNSGEEVLQRCRAMLESAQSTLEVGARHTQSVAGVVRIGIPKAVGTQVIHPLMFGFLEAHPHVDVQLFLTDRLIDPISDDVDLVIRIDDHPPPGLKGRPLLKVDYVLCASPVYLAKHGVPADPAQLREHNCIVLGEDRTDADWRFKQGGKTISVPVRGRYAANNTSIRLDAATRGHGIASLPLFTAKPGLASGAIVQVLADWDFVTGYSGNAWLLYPATRHLAPKLRVFIDYLAARLGHNGEVSEGLNN